MTSSARANNAGGKTMPSVFAVFKFRISSNFVGCSTGRSATRSPFSILIDKARGAAKDVGNAGAIRKQTAGDDGLARPEHQGQVLLDGKLRNPLTVAKEKGIGAAMTP